MIVKENHNKESLFGINSTYIEFDLCEVLCTYNLNFLIFPDAEIRQARYS